MRFRLTRVVLVVMSVALGSSGFAQTPGAAGSKPKARLSLVSAVEAVTAAQPFELGIRIELDSGWHTYWQNSGDSGLPPKVAWDLPEGFSVGSLRFPVPQRHVDRLGMSTYVLPGEPVLLATVTSPEKIANPKVTFGAKVNYLVCREKCLREEAVIRLELPVQLPGSTPKSINEDLFHRARAALPRTASKRVTVTATADVKALTQGQIFELDLAVDIAEGLGLPVGKDDHGMPRVDVFMKRIGGVYFEAPVLSDPQQLERDYATGRFTIRVPIEIDEVPPSGALSLEGVLAYTPCERVEECYPREGALFSLLVGDQNDVAASQPAESDASPPVAIPSSPPPAALLPQETRSEEGAGKPPGFLDRLGAIGLLIGCFIYGLFLNATPCVLPLLSIKVLGFVQQAHESRKRTLGLGLAFGAGVILFFIVLGLLAGAGTNILHFPVAVIALSTVVMALALGMLGVYTLNVPTTATKLEANIQREGGLASFGKGALAPVLGFACTGPLLAGAFAWATQQPWGLAVAAFTVAGLGMASPYIILGANPNWLSFLPKPGPWMITFERIMGFLLLAMVVWLLDPLVTQIGAAGLQWTLVFMVAVAMACWVLGRIDVTMPAKQRWRYRVTALLIAGAAAVAVYGWIYPIGEAAEAARQRYLAQHGGYATVDWSTGIPWRHWSREAVEREVEAGKIVFVDFTAAFCTECKANKKLATNTAEVRAKMESLGVVPFRGDFTWKDAAISAELQRFNHAGVPFNLIYRANQPDKPMVLKTVLTKSYLLEKLDEASRPE